MEATRLTHGQVFRAVRYMQHAGLVHLVGEQHEPGKPGRGTRVYTATNTPATASGTAPETLRGVPAPSAVRSAILARVRALVSEFSGRFDFTAADVAARLGLTRESVRWMLLSLTSEGLMCPLAEIRPSEGAGRPAQRWTSNPDNMATQSYLRRKLAEAEGQLR